MIVGIGLLKLCRCTKPIQEGIRASLQARRRPMPLLDYVQARFRGGQRTATDPKLVGRRLYRALDFRVVEVQLVKAQRELDMLLLTGRKRDAGKAFQFPYRLLNAGHCVADIKLNDLSSGHAAGVFYVYAHRGYRLVPGGNDLPHRDLRTGDLGFGIAETRIAEAPDRES